MSNIDSIASQLPAMSAADLLKVRQLTDMLLGQGQVTGTPAATKPDDRFEATMFEALKSELASVGINSNISYRAFSESKYFKSWKRGVDVVQKFVNDAFKGYLKTEAQRVGICRILVQTMIREFKDRGIPVSVGSVANNIHRIPQTFDRAFPGYLESGLAYLIPAALLRNKK